MASALWGKFTSEVLKEVKFKYDHKHIIMKFLKSFLYAKMTFLLLVFRCFQCSFG